MRGVKIDAPFAWTGSPDLDLYDKWVYEVETWCKYCTLSDKMSVPLLARCMSGTASEFFMKHVALQPRKWTRRAIYEALFDYCFPLPGIQHENDDKYHNRMPMFRGAAAL